VLFGRTSRPKLWSSINQYGRLVWTLCYFLFSTRSAWYKFACSIVVWETLLFHDFHKIRAQAAKQIGQILEVVWHWTENSKGNMGLGGPSFFKTKTKMLLSPIRNKRRDLV
jgi:hypothetical protein